MRTKEAANDYRYFPEPDLQPLFVDQKQIDAIKAEMPALPRELFLKYTKELGLSEYDTTILTDTKAIALYYEELITFTKNYKGAANILMGDIKSYLNQQGVEIEDFPIKAEKIAQLIELLDGNKVSSTVASQKIFPELLKNPEKNPLQIAEELNVLQDSNEDSIKGYIQEVIDKNPSEVDRYRNGEKQLVGFFMGQLMKVSQGKADPKASNQLMREMLEN
jgi:aspartyl-tRNA(Asn)/glutamyl-tRNA(Gln) amidotransferase subunit B